MLKRMFFFNIFKICLSFEKKMLDFTPAAPTLREISRYQKSTELPFQRLVKEIARVTTLIDYRRAELNNEDDHDDFPELEVRAHVPSVPPSGQRL